MISRHEVYSPLQNTAVWLAAWLYGAEPTDTVVDALRELGGRHSWAETTGVELLREVRAATELNSAGPAVRLILSGPGQPPALPPGSDAAAAMGDSGAIVLRGQSVSHILVPDYTPDSGTSWRWFEETERLPEPEWLSPGEADARLSTAATSAATIIAATDGTNANVADPRLMVGTLADFYDTPGLPMGVSPRAAKLFARADNVAAIVETVTDRLNDHSFDPQLLGLWRHIRSARMAGVADAVINYARGG
ncbi:hypothetical protein [Corynebacterium aquatimens]|uniref:Uncharacterized protein n=1 Tax=Corynebacterium aquatimens TaxID=1190508 RepID=A0A931GVS0_9CORY|nr:hypothetical protein [Corynebacterium aquatimens]MBG6121621.1 hypothetical protein [Corynebacterium aquatimens]WJY65840.1 hypothetical protein CAQUA_05660 [Corynebacterium aquatimens]